jgi:hypothetical protein
MSIEKFENTKGVIRNCKSTDRQYNDQKINDRQYNDQKIKGRQYNDQKILQGQSEAVNQRADNTMTKR